MREKKTEYSDLNPIVLDAGSSIIKAGFAGDDHPIVLFPAQGDFKPWLPDIFDESNFFYKDINTLFPKTPPSSLNSLDKLNSEDALAKRLNYIFKEGLGIDIRYYPLLFIEPPRNPPAERKKIADFLFKKLHCTKIAFLDSALASHYSYGRHMSLIVEINTNKITTTPIKGIYVIMEGCMEMNGGGHAMTNYIESQIKKQHPKIESDVHNLAQKIKETHGIVYCPSLTEPKVPEKVKELFQKRFGTSVSFPISSTEGESIKIDDKSPLRWKSADALFQKGDQGIYPMPISEFIMESINKCPSDKHRDLLCNIMLAGGGTDIVGLDVRLAEELKLLTKKDQNLQTHVMLPNHNKICAWIGGSMESSLKVFQKCWLTEKEYNDGKYHEKYSVYNSDANFTYENALLSYTKYRKN
ncbi:MAG: hypothetical protein ACTSQK_07410 [Candidatus Heimdallarchaeota archaeon]